MRCKRVSVLSSLLLLHCWRDTIVLGLYFRVGLPAVVLLGKGKVLSYSRSKLSCLIFGVHRDRNMKHDGGGKSCKRKAAPNVTRPCEPQKTHSTECPAAAGGQQGLLVLSGGFQEEPQLMYCLLVLFSLAANLWHNPELLSFWGDVAKPSGVPARQWPLWHVKHHLAVGPSAACPTVLLSFTVPWSRHARGCRAQDACCCFVPFPNSSGMPELPSQLPVRPCISVQHG